MKTLIAIPCMDMIHTDFARALLGLRLVGDTQYTFAQASLVYDARNTLANIALSGDFDRVLWLDSDMLFDAGLLERLNADLDAGGIECVSALYFSRKPPIKPVIYKRCFLDRSGEEAKPTAECFADYPADALFPIAGCGFGAVLMTTALLRRVRDTYGLPFSPALGFGEDLSFCLRVAELGEQIWCDSRAKCGHVGLAVYDERSYARLTSNREEREGSP